MADLIVPAGTTLTIDGTSFTIAAKYGLFRMESNSTIRTAVDVTLKADRAEFEQNCLIDARGTGGAKGTDGAAGVAGASPDGLNGKDGFPGQRGSHVTISAALAEVGGLTVITDGGAGGPGGVGGAGAAEPGLGTGAGNGGRGGQGGVGGRAGQIAMSWIRAASGLPTQLDTAPPGHHYRSNGGPGGAGGPGGVAGQYFIRPGQDGASGNPGSPGPARAPSVTWKADIASLLWAQAQDMGPPARTGHGLAFDPERQKLVLFGGLVNGTAVNDTWEWDGELWTQVADTGPSPRAYHGQAFDPVGRGVLLFGGADGADVDGRQYLGDTWRWDGTAWMQLADTGPSPRQASAMAADPVRKRVVLFGGGQIDREHVNQGLSDTWEWDGTAWVQQADTGPEGRLDAKAAYSEQDAAILLFGGAGSGPPLADTWAWDGQLWRQVADTGPSPRIGHALASLDSAVILFGGMAMLPAADAESGILNDTWAWLSGGWCQTQDMGPSPRSGHAMACAAGPIGERVTVFGGQGQGIQQDTWQLAEPF